MIDVCAIVPDETNVAAAAAAAISRHRCIDFTHAAMAKCRREAMKDVGL